MKAYMVAQGRPYRPEFFDVDAEFGIFLKKEDAEAKARDLNGEHLMDYYRTEELERAEWTAKYNDQTNYTNANNEILRTMGREAPEDKPLLPLPRLRSFEQWLTETNAGGYYVYELEVNE